MAQLRKMSVDMTAENLRQKSLDWALNDESTKQISGDLFTSEITFEQTSYSLYIAYIQL